MVAFLIMVTETYGKAANEYEYVEGANPVYMKKLQRVSRSPDKDDEDDEDESDTGRQFCCCPRCASTCSCCCA